MKRILITAGVVVAVLALVITMWVTRPEAESEPSAGVIGGVTVPPEPTAFPGPDFDTEAPSVPGTPETGGDAIPGNVHGHNNDGIDAVPACGVEGPYTLTCEETEETLPDIPNPEVMAAGNAIARAFAPVWATIDPSESSAARAARLVAAGASGGVSAQVPALTRPGTRHSSLVTVARPINPLYVSFDRPVPGGNEYLISMNVSVTYTLAGTQKQDWNMPGSVFVVIDPATGKITALREVFRALADIE